VADPATVTVRIESASTNDLNVQDVVTTSSSSDDDDDDLHKQHNNNDRLHYGTSSATGHRHTSSLTTHNNSLHQQRPSRLSTDVNSSMRVPQNRPITAVSLPAKPSTYDNEWDFDSAPTLVSSTQRRNPSCPSISPTNKRAKQSFVHQQVPTIFTTTSECLGKNNLI
jgi:hypothetical protein